MKKAERRELGLIIETMGFGDWVWIDPKDIVVAQWVRLKCAFGCAEYGRNASCPPNTPSVKECRDFIGGYSSAVMLHFPKTVARPEDRHVWSREVNSRLLALEREVFLAGYYKAFLLAMDSSGLCSECAGERSKCKLPRASRPSPEAMAVDVFATARACGLPIEVLRDPSQEMNRYALLMIE
jgi:predicted metal-binding protein